MFVGIDLASKSYLVWSEGKLEATRNVKFFEDQFTYGRSQSNSKTPTFQEIQEYTAELESELRGVADGESDSDEEIPTLNEESDSSDDSSSDKAVRAGGNITLGCSELRIPAIPRALSGEFPGQGSGLQSKRLLSALQTHSHTSRQAESDAEQ